MERQPKSILITDCGISMTTAVLIERSGGEYRLSARGEAPTTVELPFVDVTIGIENAIKNIEESRGKRLLKQDHAGILTPEDSEGHGVDLYLSTSSTGGGLQMMVAGLVRIMTAESAERAALGAGAMVMDVISIDDGRFPHAKIQRLRELKPDMILLSGGIDDGNYEYVLELAEHIAEAKLRPDLPVIYAGNIAARERVEQILHGKATLFFVENVRPVLEKEVLEPASQEIHKRFMDHVVTHAPGYKKLSEWTHAPIIPTTGAVGYVIEGIASHYKQNVLGVNVGDATTDVYSVFGDRFTRTVSGDLGLGSSISNVLLEAGFANVSRWLPYDITEGEMRNMLRNKTLRSTTIPSSLEDLMVEHAVLREILRLALEQHKGSVVGLRGVRRQRDVSQTFNQTGSGDTLVDLMSLDTIVASGAVFSQAPRSSQTMLMLVDAFQPEGITHLAVDQHYTAPHLGILSAHHPEMAFKVFRQDSLVQLGAVVAPVGTGKMGQDCISIEIEQNGQLLSKSCPFGVIQLLSVPEGRVTATISPAAGFDIGYGRGKSVTMELTSGVCGIVVDGRGRNPLELPSDKHTLLTWHSVLKTYPLVKGGLK